GIVFLVEHRHHRAVLCYVGRDHVGAVIEHLLQRNVGRFQLGRNFSALPTTLAPVSGGQPAAEAKVVIRNKASGSEISNLFISILQFSR
ncbi:hypothetical protein, partial [Pseudomonas viridiflava]|uniref:hypothetical protein n=1 Tax=Pseudomonas viridiflava TaxID=33069 RepID=UPI00197EFC63